ncbi:MAG: HIT domain-containing protein [Candidatus Krumholzibacteriota bacterium]|nr:HIT domain-containing protein [Candidatus Krumholzibacteriota bacterium]
MDSIYAPWRSRYFTMEKQDGCLLCDIQKEKDDAKAGILKRGKNWFVLINLFPYTSGHIMVVACRHIGKVSDITEEEGKDLVAFLSLGEKAINAVYRPDAMNIGVNLGSSAGAGIVGHLHFHLVPRWNGDTNFMTAISGTRVVSEDPEESFKKLISFFSETDLDWS